MTERTDDHTGGRGQRHLRVVGARTGQPGLSPRTEPGSSKGDVSVYENDGTVIVLLRGSIDMSQAQELEEAGGYAIEKDMPIEVDVRHVDLIDSVGISFLVRVAASIRAHGGSVVLCGPAPGVEELLTVAGASSLFVWAEGRLGRRRATP